MIGVEFKRLENNFYTQIKTENDTQVKLLIIINIIEIYCYDDTEESFIFNVIIYAHFYLDQTLINIKMVNKKKKKLQKLKC